MGFFLPWQKFELSALHFSQSWTSCSELPLPHLYLSEPSSPPAAFSTDCRGIISKRGHGIFVCRLVIDSSRAGSLSAHFWTGRRGFYRWAARSGKLNVTSKEFVRLSVGAPRWTFAAIKQFPHFLFPAHPTSESPPPLQFCLISREADVKISAGLQQSSWKTQG